MAGGRVRKRVRFRDTHHDELFVVHAHCIVRENDFTTHEGQHDIPHCEPGWLGLGFGVLA